MAYTEALDECMDVFIHLKFDPVKRTMAVTRRCEGKNTYGATAWAEITRRENELNRAIDHGIIHIIDGQPIGG